MHRPDAAVLAAFLLVVLIGGTNFVGVRFSNRELPPFWGAGIRFAAAAVLLLAYARLTGHLLPRGRALGAAAFYGVLTFFGSYALAYWGLLEAPAALASTIVATVPLLTFLLAVWQGLERFSWGGVLGGALALIGVGIVFADQITAAVPIASIVALLAAAVVIALSTVVLKQLRGVHPISTNAVAMVPGAALLLALSAVAGETTTLPRQPEVWTALVYLVTVGSIGLFVGFTFVVMRWTASATSYATVLFPVVTVALGAVLAGELVSLRFVLGTLLVMLGVYVGALAQPAPRPVPATPAD